MTGVTSAASNAERRKGHSIACIVFPNSDSSYASSVATEVSKRAAEASSGVIFAHVEMLDSFLCVNGVISTVTLSETGVYTQEMRFEVRSNEIMILIFPDGRRKVYQS